MNLKIQMKYDKSEKKTVDCKVHVASAPSAWSRVSMGASVGVLTGADVPPGTQVTTARCHQPIRGSLVT